MPLWDDDRWMRPEPEEMIPPTQPPVVPPLPVGPDVGPDVPRDPTGGDAPYDFGTWTPPSYSGPWSPTMSFIPPPQFDAPEFAAPSFEDAQNEPGYEFRMAQGTNALERSAAARGVTRTGNTLTDLLEYGQNFGAQEYNNVYHRALGAYDRNYRAAWDQFQPQLQDWQFRSGFGRDASLAGFDRSWDSYALQAQLDLERERMLFEASLAPPPPPGDANYY